MEAMLAARQQEAASGSFMKGIGAQMGNAAMPLHPSFHPAHGLASMAQPVPGLAVPGGTPSGPPRALADQAAGQIAQPGGFASPQI